MWKYANPGDYRLLHRHNSKTYQNVTNDWGRGPKTGQAYTTQMEGDYPINIPDGTSELWFRADILVADKVTLCFNTYNDLYRVELTLTKEGWQLKTNHRGYDYAAQKFAVLTANDEDKMDLDGRYATIVLHIKSGHINESSVFNQGNGCVELRINNRIVVNRENIAVMNGESILLPTFASFVGLSYFSNIIVSDQKVLSREHVYVLPVKSVLTNGWVADMVDNTQVGWTTNQVGKDIIQTIDVNTLKEKLGNAITIASLSVQAYDVSTNDEDYVDSIDQVVRIGGEEFNVGSSKITSSSYINNAIMINPFTRKYWTLDDLETTELILRSAKSTD